MSQTIKKQRTKDLFPKKGNIFFGILIFTSIYCALVAIQCIKNTQKFISFRNGQWCFVIENKFLFGEVNSDLLF